MLPNRTYNGLTDRACRTDELKEEARLRAELSVKGRRRCSLQLGADRRLLIAAYKKARETQASGALEALQRDFHIVEQALLSLDEAEQRRLPVLIHGSHAGLPRVYDIAACIVGGRDGRVDEGAISRFLDAYQSVAPLTMAEIGALRDMLNAALIKLLSVECGRAMDSLKAEEAASAAVDQLMKQRTKDRRRSTLEKLDFGENPALVERLYTLLSERDMGDAIDGLTERLYLEDQDIEELCARARSERARGTQRTENAIHSLRLINSMDWETAFEQYS